MNDSGPYCVGRTILTNQPGFSFHLVDGLLTPGNCSLGFNWILVLGYIWLFTNPGGGGLSLIGKVSGNGVDPHGDRISKRDLLVFVCLESLSGRSLSMSEMG